MLNGAEAKLARSSSDLLAPLPNLRLELIGALSERWTAYFNAGWLSIDYDNWQGDYLFSHLRIDYRVSSRFGVGIGYQITDLDIDHRNRRVRESYDVRYQGPTVYLTCGF